MADSVAEAQRAFRLTRVINRGLVKPTGTASVTRTTRHCVFAATTTSDIIKLTVEAVQWTQESREFSHVCECSPQFTVSFPFK